MLPLSPLNAIDRTEKRIERARAVRLNVTDAIKLHFGGGGDPADLHDEAMLAISDACELANDFAVRRLIRPNGRWRWTTKQR